MTIEIIKKDLDELFKDLDKLIDSNNNKGKTIDASLDKVLDVFGRPEFKKNIHSLYNLGYLESFSFDNLLEMELFFEETYRKILEIKNDLDLKKFYNNNKKYDFNALKTMWKERRLKDKFPNFNFKLYKELTLNPKLSYKNYKGEDVVLDKYVIQKIILGIHQMLFSEMDLYIINSGKEGAGKSCWSSQLLFYIYNFLKEVGLIEYALEVKKMFFSSVEAVLDMQEQTKNKDYFRIVVLDEAYDLNRNNFKDDKTKVYKDDMRSARKNLRINILNLPQLGELDTSITLTRTNFVFYCTMDNDIKTGTLKKGIVHMYVFPRGDKIYSNYHRKYISDSQIQESFSKMLEKKSNYYAGMPKDVIVHEFKFNNVWGFNKEEYDEHIKNENKKKRIKDDMKLSLYQQYILFKFMPELKEFGFDMDNKKHVKMYKTLNALMRKIKNNFTLKPENMHKMDYLYGDNGTN